MKKIKFDWTVNDWLTPSGEKSAANGRLECSVNGVNIGFVAKDEFDDPTLTENNNPTCYVCQHFDGEITSTTTLDAVLAMSQIETRFSNWYNGIEYIEME